MEHQIQSNTKQNRMCFFVQKESRNSVQCGTYIFTLYFNLIFFISIIFFLFLSFLPNGYLYQKPNCRTYISYHLGKIKRNKSVKHITVNWAKMKKGIKMTCIFAIQCKIPSFNRQDDNYKELLKR